MSTAPNPDASPPADAPPPHPPRNLTVTHRVADVLTDLGGIAADRLYSGIAEPAGPDELREAHRQGNVCELVDGYLVERAMGYRESLLAMMIGRFLIDFVSAAKLGVVSGAEVFQVLNGPDEAPPQGNEGSV
ncbi:hypothetical protein CKO51_04720 [Rhodopirellula sp. SM50]|nr:hypothetical protein [Rhodopirellula sp. SM50]PAY20701.1 hypothetical protein CKO51_04720 [Rhodopirellula sp. SM50]